jgi:hypothetical protein
MLERYTGVGKIESIRDLTFIIIKHNVNNLYL